ncbi:MAG: hypothetical protein WA705_02145 [Candidatus Ozemobacteraceae bacterium]
MKRLVVLLAVFMIVASPTFTRICSAQEEVSEGTGETAKIVGSEEIPGNSDTPGQEKIETPGSEGKAEPSPEESKVEENPVVEKTYTCPNCSYALDAPGDCPACNIGMVEKTDLVPNTDSASSNDSYTSSDSDSRQSENVTPHVRRRSYSQDSSVDSSPPPSPVPAGNSSPRSGG